LIFVGFAVGPDFWFSEFFLELVSRKCCHWHYTQAKVRKREWLQGASGAACITRNAKWSCSWRICNCLETNERTNGSFFSSNGPPHFCLRTYYD
jgi:hypothetical protein